MIFSKMNNFFNTLFVKLFTSFLAIIIILLSFNFFILRFYTSNMHTEILKSNNGLFNYNVLRYDEYFSKLKKAMDDVYFNRDVQALRRSKSEWQYEVLEIVNLFNTLFDKNIFFLDNVFLMMEDKDIIISANGTFNVNSFFSYHYISTSYGKEFWLGLFNDQFNSRALGASAFTSFNEVYSNGGRLLMPVVYKKNIPGESRYFLCALVDIEKLKSSIERPLDPYFFILNDNDEQIYPVDRTIDHKLIENNNNSYRKEKTEYIFYNNSEINGLKYVKIYPIEGINSQIARLNFLLFIFLLIASSIAIAFSIIQSYKLRDPVIQIVKAINEHNTNHNFQHNLMVNTSIAELKYISSKLKTLFDEKVRIGSDLTNKNSLLKYYFYHNKIKNINSNLKELDQNSLIFGPYMVVVYKVVFKQGFSTDFYNQYEKALNFIHSFIETTITEKFDSSITFESENEHFVTIISLSNECEKTDVIEIINFIKTVMINDIEYFLMVISYSDIYKDVSKLSNAYKEAFDIIKHRSLSNMSQILSKKDISTSTNKIYFTLEQEKRIAEAMFNGDNDELVLVVDSILNDNYNRNINAYFFNKLSIEIINNFIKTLNQLKIDTSKILNIKTMYENLENFYTLEQYLDFFHESIKSFTDYVITTKKDFDYIKNFVLDYIHNNYQSDIYLDFLAEKLNITSPYLSSYFKEKTGVNFIDYLNNYRISKAIELLKESNKMIHEIAAETGFKSVNTYIRTFKKYTGKTPSEYRREKGIP